MLSIFYLVFHLLFPAKFLTASSQDFSCYWVQWSVLHLSFLDFVLDGDFFSINRGKKRWHTGLCTWFFSLLPHQSFPFCLPASYAVEFSGFSPQCIHLHNQSLLLCWYNYYNTMCEWLVNFYVWPDPLIYCLLLVILLIRAPQINMTCSEILMYLFRPSWCHSLTFLINGSFTQTYLY